VAQLYPRHRVPILVAFYDMHGLQWDYYLNEIHMEPTARRAK